MKIALIVSTYNWPAALDLCFKSVLKQYLKPDEIIIADDGSTADTKSLIDSFCKQTEIPIKHIWQEDNGFRLSRIRNLAIKNTTCEYLVFIDGDIILHPKFLKSHKKFSKQNQLIVGSRVLLSNSKTQKAFKNNSIKITPFSLGIKNRINAIHCDLLAQLFSKMNPSYLNVRGCNMSFWKRDLLEVNGFDEQFEGWGREDSDIVLRMLNAGKKKLKLKFGAIQYHLFHKIFSRQTLQKNEKILHRTFIEKRVKAVKGFSEIQ
jgi:glycosyltransferase involved in cell wall biosynthesis